MKKEDGDSDQVLLVAQIEELMERFEEEKREREEEENREEERSDRDAKRGEEDLQPLSRMIHGATEDEPEDREVEPTFDEGR